MFRGGSGSFRVAAAMSASSVVRYLIGPGRRGAAGCSRRSGLPSHRGRGGAPAVRSARIAGGGDAGRARVTAGPSARCDGRSRGRRHAVGCSGMLASVARRMRPSASRTAGGRRVRGPDRRVGGAADRAGRAAGGDSQDQFVDTSRRQAGSSSASWPACGRGRVVTAPAAASSASERWIGGLVCLAACPERERRGRGQKHGARDARVGFAQVRTRSRGLPGTRRSARCPVAHRRGCPLRCASPMRSSRRSVMCRPPSGGRSRCGAARR